MNEHDDGVGGALSWGRPSDFETPEFQAAHPLVEEANDVAPTLEDELEALTIVTAFVEDGPEGETTREVALHSLDILRMAWAVRHSADDDLPGDWSFCKFCDGTGRVDENGDPVYPKGDGR